MFAGLHKQDVDSAERVLSPERASSPEEQADTSDGQKDFDAGYPPMNERQKKLFELRLKMVRRVFLHGNVLPQKYLYHIQDELHLLFLAN